MSIRKLEKPDWRTFFDSMSKALAGSQAEIEVASLALGDQAQTSWLPLIGLAYDPKDDEFEVALEGLDHLIRKPKDVYVDDGPGGLLASVEIIDADGLRQIVKLKEPLAVPSSQS